MTEGAGGSENIQICMTSLMDDPFVLILADGYGTFQKCPVRITHKIAARYFSFAQHWKRVVWSDWRHARYLLFPGRTHLGLASSRRTMSLRDFPEYPVCSTSMTSKSVSFRGNPSCTSPLTTSSGHRRISSCRTTMTREGSLPGAKWPSK